MPTKQMLYLVRFDMRPEVQVKSFASFQHLNAIPLHSRYVNDCSRRGHILEMPSHESFP